MKWRFWMVGVAIFGSAAVACAGGKDEASGLTESERNASAWTPSLETKLRTWVAKIVEEKPLPAPTMFDADCVVDKIKQTYPRPRDLTRRPDTEAKLRLEDITIECLTVGVDSDLPL